MELGLGFGILAQLDMVLDKTNYMHPFRTRHVLKKGRGHAMLVRNILALESVVRMHTCGHLHMYAMRHTNSQP